MDPATIRESVRAVILSIKPLNDGVPELADDAPLFSRPSGAPSPIELDSLDALDLAMCLGNEFGIDDEEFDRLLDSDEGLEKLSTINDITDLILSYANNSAGQSPVHA
jgi:acyl carrier protein